MLFNIIMQYFSYWYESNTILFLNRLKMYKSIAFKVMTINSLVSFFSVLAMSIARYWFDEIIDIMITEVLD